MNSIINTDSESKSQLPDLVYLMKEEILIYFHGELEIFSRQPDYIDTHWDNWVLKIDFV